MSDRTPRAFTLIELMLALGLLAVFIGVAAIGLEGVRARAALEEGVARFETVLRMARNDASQTGKRLRIAFNEETGGIDVLIEADPLQSPGEFLPYKGCTWLHQLPGELVRIQSSGFDVEGLEPDDDPEAAMQPITFYPDGTADSMRVTLASVHDSDQRIAVVEFDGLSGRMRSTIGEERRDDI